MGDTFSDYEKGGLATERRKLALAKASATAISSATPALTPAPSPAPPPAPAPYPLFPTATERVELEKLVTQCDLGPAYEAVPGIRTNFRDGVRKYLGYAPTDSSVKGVREAEARRFRPSEADLVLNLNFRPDVLRDVLFVSTKFGWNPDEVLALWQIEGLAPWIRHTTGTSQADVATYEHGWKTFPFDAAVSKHVSTKALAAVMARSQLLYSYWGLDRLVPHSWNSSAKDNVLTVTTKIKDHDSAFDTGFNNEIAPCLPGVTAQDVREALLNDGIEVFEKTKMFRLKPTYQATLLALQHALFRCRERQIAADKEVKTKAGMRASLVPPFAALVYLYFNSMNPKQNALLMLNALSGAPSSYGSGDLCRAFVTSELPPGVIKVLANCPNGRLNCHGYMNALRFEFVRQVYELLFKNANVGSVRGCANP